MAEHTGMGHDRERSLVAGYSGSGHSKETGGKKNYYEEQSRKVANSSEGSNSHGSTSSSHKRSTRNWKNITTHVQVVQRMNKASISSRDHSKDRVLTSEADGDGSRGSRESTSRSSSSRSRQSSIRFSDHSNPDSIQRSKPRHNDHGSSGGHIRSQEQNVYDGYYQQPSKASLSSALDEMMLDMSSSSTIVECYCGQNSCPQCNLLLKMAGSDG